MTDGSPYNANPELMAMKEDISKRRFGLTVKKMLIGGALVVAGIAAGMALLPAVAPTMFAGGTLFPAYFGGVVGMMVGGHIANLATMKESERLKIDEQYVNTYLQGKNHWGEGYREEVAEHGYSLAGPVSGLPPHAGKDVANQR